jgi:hypothetical protein
MALSMLTLTTIHYTSLSTFSLAICVLFELKARIKQFLRLVECTKSIKTLIFHLDSGEGDVSYIEYYAWQYYY